MVGYNYCPSCGNDEVLDITSDITYFTCTNPSCRFCHIIVPLIQWGIDVWNILPYYR